jgi:hypothetical protein
MMFRRIRHTRNDTMRLPILFAAALLVVLPGRAAAHDLKATVKLLPNEIVVEAGFDDDTPAEGARVVILDATGSEAASGKTDERGVFRTAKLNPGKYTATVESAGHRDEVPFEIAAPEFLDAPLEYVRARPDKTTGVVVGVGVLLAVSFAFWWVRLRRPAR